MKIYIATSWKLEMEAKALAENLRLYGHEVDLFCDPTTGRFVFSFQALGDPAQIDQHQINENELAQRAFKQDRAMIEWSDAVVMLLPCGKSAHLEAGYAKGLGKKFFIYDLAKFPKGQIDVMYQFADGFAVSFHNLRGMLDASEPPQWKEKKIRGANPPGKNAGRYRTVSDTITGKVKWFNFKKGFGFIERDDNRKDIFVHFSSIQEGQPGQKGLKEGDTVSFVEETTEKGLQAGQVKKL